MKLPIIEGTQTKIDHKKCGQIIRNARIKKEISLMDLADTLEIASSFLSDLERGNRNWTEERFQQALQCVK